MRFVSRDGEDASFEDVRHRARHYRPHPLHSQEMVWKQTNCYVDMWLEVLRWWGFNPYAALPFTIALDFEGDQFTFFKFPHDDWSGCTASSCRSTRSTNRSTGTSRRRSRAVT
ncbi:hypothetical protein CSX04_03725 [Burkholderia cepacia]|nr:hypothetical protein CSX04_03725 [Burkholderia cepacia]